MVIRKGNCLGVIQFVCMPSPNNLSFLQADSSAAFLDNQRAITVLYGAILLA